MVQMETVMFTKLPEALTVGEGLGKEIYYYIIVQSPIYKDITL